VGQQWGIRLFTRDQRDAVEPSQEQENVAFFLQVVASMRRLPDH
jgi:hypothetical protein